MTEPLHLSRASPVLDHADAVPTAAPARASPHTVQPSQPCRLRVASSDCSFSSAISRTALDVSTQPHEPIRCFRDERTQLTERHERPGPTGQAQHLQPPGASEAGGKKTINPVLKISNLPASSSAVHELGQAALEAENCSAPRSESIAADARESEGARTAFPPVISPVREYAFGRDASFEIALSNSMRRADKQSDRQHLPPVTEVGSDVVPALAQASLCTQTALSARTQWYFMPGAAWLCNLVSYGCWRGSPLTCTSAPRATPRC